MSEATPSTPSRRKKGDLEWVVLAELAPKEPGVRGMRVAIRHEGPGLLRDWSFQLQTMRLDELRRIVALRAGLSPTDAPELYDGLHDAAGKVLVQGVRDARGNIRTVTPEGLRAAVDFAVGVVAQVVTKIEGSDVDGAEPAAIAAELRRLGVVELVMERVMEVQALTRAERFPAASPGDV